MLSVIITTWKEPETVKKAIQSVLDEKIKEDYEILVVAPDKETLDSAKSFQKKHKEIKILKDPCKGKPTALNMVFKKAKGRILILTDGDVYTAKDAVKSLLPYFEDKKVGAVTGHPVSTNDRTTMLGYWSHLLNDAAHVERLRRDKKSQFIFCTGYLFAMRKGIIKEMPEDVLDDGYISALIWKEGYKIKYSPDSIVYIKNPTTLKDWIKQKKRNAIGHDRIEYYLGKMPRMKSLSNEIIHGWYKALIYPKTPKEFGYTLILFPFRLYTWFLGRYDKRDLMKIWVRIETTK